MLCLLLSGQGFHEEIFSKVSYGKEKLGFIFIMSLFIYGSCFCEDKVGIHRDFDILQKI